MSKRKPSPATIISLVALFFSLGGAGLAARHYLITSVSQISPKVRNALRGQQGPMGPQGQVGPAGPAGPTGPQGPSSTPPQTIVGQCYKNGSTYPIVEYNGALFLLGATQSASDTSPATLAALCTSQGLNPPA